MGYDNEIPWTAEVKLWVKGGVDPVDGDGSVVEVDAGVGDGDAEAALPTPPGAAGPRN